MMGTISYEKRQAFLNDPNDKRHGTARGYQLRCRCDRCKEAGVEYIQRSKERAYQRYLEKAREPKAKEKARKPKAKPKDICTVDELYKPLMGKPSLSNADGTCCWCGKPGATNHHHIVKRSAGKWVVNGREIAKPTVLLCGDGNASGCHGKAHNELLHFRWNDDEGPNTKPLHWQGDGHLEGLEVDEPMKYQKALGMDGWRRLRTHEGE